MPAQLNEQMNGSLSAASNIICFLFVFCFLTVSFNRTTRQILLKGANSGVSIKDPTYMYRMSGSRIFATITMLLGKLLHP